MIWNERGLTLAEILIAVAIIGIGLVGLMVVVPIASYGVHEGSQLSTATFLAEQRLEQIRNAVWSDTIDCVGLSATATSEPVPSGPPAGLTCNGSSAVTFADENNVQWGNDTRAGSSGTTLPGGYRRQTRISACSVAPGCAGVQTCPGGCLACPPTCPRESEMRRVLVTVTYLPLTSSGASPTAKTISVEWLVSQK